MEVVPTLVISSGVDLVPWARKAVVGAKTSDEPQNPKVPHAEVSVNSAGALVM